MKNFKDLLDNLADKFRKIPGQFKYFFFNDFVDLMNFIHFYLIKNGKELIIKLLIWILTCEKHSVFYRRNFNRKM